MGRKPANPKEVKAAPVTPAAVPEIKARRRAVETPETLAPPQLPAKARPAKARPAKPAFPAETPKKAAAKKTAPAKPVSEAGAEKPARAARKPPETPPSPVRAKAPRAQKEEAVTAPTPKAGPRKKIEEKPAASAPIAAKPAGSKLPKVKPIASETAKAPIRKPASTARTRSVPVYVVRSGPKAGPADLEAAFGTKQEALSFLVNVHGLSTDEQRKLAKEHALKLNRRWHGSEACAIREVPMSRERAQKALSGEMFEP